MEISQKYTRTMIVELALESGFEIETEFFNDQDFYTDSLWRPSPTLRSRRGDVSEPKSK